MRLEKAKADFTDAYMLSCADHDIQCDEAKLTEQLEVFTVGFKTGKRKGPKGKGRGRSKGRGKRKRQKAGSEGLQEAIKI